jgi:hypothetical protein
VRVVEGDANGGGDQGGVRWRSGRISGQNQPIDGPKDTAGATSHHRVDVPGVAVNSDQVVHRRLRGRRRGRLAVMIDDDGVDKLDRTCQGTESARRGRSAPAAVVNEGGVSEVSPARRRGRARRRRG